MKRLHRKVVYAGLSVGVFLAAAFYCFVQTTTPKVLDRSNCAFCNEAVLKKQAFYENSHIIALYNYKPVKPCHLLVIPKRHVERLEDLSEKELTEIFASISKVHTAASKVFQISSYFIHQKNGVEAGQSVPHVHFHYIGFEEGDGSSLKFLANIALAYIKKPINDNSMEKAVYELTEAME